VELIFSQEITQLEKTIRESCVDLVVLEYSDDWENDLRAIKAIKATLPNLPFIIVDGNASNEIVIRSFRAGLEDYFKKPCDPFLLAERVDALLKRKRTTKDK
jgi:DNA-binding response OmpR family regulator